MVALHVLMRKRDVMSKWKFLIMIALTVGVISFVAVQAHPKGAKALTLTALDYAEIQQLSIRYCHTLDTCADRGNEFANLFAPDGVWISRKRRAQGHEALAAWAGGPDYCTNNPLAIRHVALNTMIEASPEGAIGKSYVLQLTIGKDGSTGMIRGGGKYYDVYVKTAEGWRFKSRTFAVGQDVDFIPASELSHHPLPR